MQICDMTIQLFMLLMTTYAGECDEWWWKGRCKRNEWMCDDTPNPCKKNGMESAEGGIDRRDRSIAKKPRIKEAGGTWEKDYVCHLDEGGQNITIDEKQEMKQGKKTKLKKPKSGRSTRCREWLQRKHLRPSIFSAHLDDDDGGGIRNVWGKEQGLLHRRSWRRGLRDLGEWVGKQIKRNTLRWTGMIQACRMCGGILVSSKRYS